MPATKLLLSKLLLSRSGNSRLFSSMAALCIGTALLLLSVLVWWNFNELLRGGGNADSSGGTFLTISRRVSNEKMGNASLTVFSKSDIEALRKVPEVQAVGDLVSVKDKVNMRMSLGGNLSFSTIMFLEAVPDEFMDRLPPDWAWKEGQTQLPIILSSEFLSLYNYVFAPAQGLPQLSEESIKALPFRLELGPDGHEDVYLAHIAGFSDRITSVLVPESFALYANRKSGLPVSPPSRLVVKVSDPSSEAFATFLKTNDYVTNSEQLKWSRMRAIVQVVAGTTGLLALLLMGISVLVFNLFIELTIARAQQSVRLLLELGFSPDRLSAFLYRKFLPLLALCFLVALMIAVLTQMFASAQGKNTGLALSYWPGWPVWAVAAFAFAALFVQVRFAIRKALSNA